MAALAAAQAAAKAAPPPVVQPKAPVVEGPLEVRPTRQPSSAARSATKSGPPAGASPREASPGTLATTAAAAVVETKPSAAATVAPGKPATDPVATAANESATKTTTAAETPTIAKVDQVDEEKAKADEEELAKAEAEEKAKAAAKKRAINRLRRIRFGRDPLDQSAPLFGTSTIVFAAVAIGCVAFLFWRRGQRRMELEATAVSHTPFGNAAVVDTGAMFTGVLLAGLSAKRFERVVASYYAKTGVVAEQTNAGPTAPVHIKIFWKGEPKPFAGVQCHASPPGLIGVKPLQDLFTELSSAEIRRGYVVTTGKFNVEARDFAEEKHFTLLPGDIFLEKINALPPAARSELLKEANAPETAAPAGSPAT